MTKEELLNIPGHSRVRYIGKDPAVVKALTEGSKSYATKGAVLTYVVDYSKNSWGDKEGIVISTWSSGLLKNCKPEDWEVIDSRRIDLTRKREKSKVFYADRAVRQELGFIDQWTGNLSAYKRRIEMSMSELPVADRLKIMVGLTDMQRAWIDALDLNPLAVKEAIDKAVMSLVSAEEPSSEPVVR